MTEPFRPTNDCDTSSLVRGRLDVDYVPAQAGTLTSKPTPVRGTGPRQAAAPHVTVNLARAGTQKPYARRPAYLRVLPATPLFVLPLSHFTLLKKREICLAAWPFVLVFSVKYNFPLAH